MATGGSKAVVRYLSDEARQDLDHLSKHRDKIDAIAQSASTLNFSIGLADAAASLSKQLDLPLADTDRILSTIWNLYRLKRRLNLDSNSLIAAIVGQIDQGGTAAWQEIGQTLEKALDSLTDDHPLVVAKKAEQLGRAHQNVLQEARLITDVRPVFDTTGDKILESIVIHTLIVHYYDGTELRRMALAMDAADVADLRRSCDRADRKVRTIIAGLKPCGWTTAVIGEPEQFQLEQGPDK